MSSDTTFVRHALVERLVSRFPQDAAVQLEAFEPADSARLLEKQTASDAANVLSRMRPDLAVDAIKQLTDEHARNILTQSNPAYTARWLARLPEGLRNKTLELLAPDLKNEITSLMAYSPETAGALMDPVFTTVRPQSTLREALLRVQKARQKKIHQLLVVQDNGLLVGVVPLAEVAVGDPTMKVADLMGGSPRSVTDTASATEVVEVFEKHNLQNLPVVDFEGRLVGVIRHDALVRAATAEATTDMQAMVGASREERALSSAPFAVRKRLPWLHINLLTAFLAAFVVGLFEGTIARFTALAILMPVAAGQSGNTGAQALAVTMRGLALREIRIRHWLRVTSKELAVGAFNGIAIGIVTSLAVLLWSRSYGLATVIGVAMVVSMTIASAAGALVPIILTLLNQDPAQSSSIILTTITDIVGFVSFLGLATLMSGLL